VGSALQGQVDGLGGTAGPDDFAGVCTNQIGHLHRAFSTASSASQPQAWLRDAGLPKVLAQPWDHGIHNAWIDRVVAP
jgi:hypothetical protein